jgi:hypothetical protein
MPSRKQRRRREKLKRHEWEEVYVDENGRVLDPDEAEQLIKPEKAARTKAQPTERGRRVVEPPSWRRTFKRGALFFPLMLIVVFFVNSKNSTTAQSIVSTVTLMAFFLPFSYFMDTMMYRSWQRRTAQNEAKKS